MTACEHHDTALSQVLLLSSFEEAWIAKLLEVSLHDVIQGGAPHCGKAIP